MRKDCSALSCQCWRKWQMFEYFCCKLIDWCRFCRKRMENLEFVSRNHLLLNVVIFVFIFIVIQWPTGGQRRFFHSSTFSVLYLRAGFLFSHKKWCPRYDKITYDLFSSKLNKMSSGIDKNEALRSVYGKYFWTLLCYVTSGTNNWRKQVLAFRTEITRNIPEQTAVVCKMNLKFIIYAKFLLSRYLKTWILKNHYKIAIFLMKTRSNIYIQPVFRS